MKHIHILRSSILNINRSNKVQKFTCWQWRKRPHVCSSQKLDLFWTEWVSNCHGISHHLKIPHVIPKTLFEHILVLPLNGSFSNSCIDPIILHQNYKLKTRFNRKSSLIKSQCKSSKSTKLPLNRSTSSLVQHHHGVDYDDREPKSSHILSI